MKPLPRVYRQYVQEKAPRFARAVAQVKETGRTTPSGRTYPASDTDPDTEPAVMTTLEEFEEDLALLYAGLWFAHSQGVAVTFTPPPVKAHRRSIPTQRP